MTDPWCCKKREIPSPGFKTSSPCTDGPKSLDTTPMQCSSYWKPASQHPKKSTNKTSVIGSSACRFSMPHSMGLVYLPTWYLKNQQISTNWMVLVAFYYKFQPKVNQMLVNQFIPKFQPNVGKYTSPMDGSDGLNPKRATRGARHTDRFPCVLLCGGGFCFL